MVAYAIDTFLEASGALNYTLFTRFCSFIISAFGLMAAYSFLQFRANHILIGGLFGIAIIASFGTWVAGELVASFVVTEEDVEIVEYINLSVMAGFSISLITRFFWLRSVMPIEPKYVRS